MAYRYQVDIGGVMYPQNRLKSCNLTQPLFDKFSPGNACSAEFTMAFWPTETVPTAAKVTPYIWREETEEWEKLGGFYIDTRSKQGTALEVVCYDLMLRAEEIWEPDQSLEFPMTMRAASEEIARLMGTTLDPRCDFWSSGTVDYPADRTMREVLCDIASANLGNWIVTAEEKLLLVPLFDSAPKETNYLVTERGAAIVIGRTRILV